jgi:hypothetical protein
LELVVIKKVANLQGRRMLKATEPKPNAVAKNGPKYFHKIFRSDGQTLGVKHKEKGSRVHLGNLE